MVDDSAILMPFGKHQGTGPLPPWSDGWGSPENHQQGGPPPFDVDDPLDTEFREIVQ